MYTWSPRARATAALNLEAPIADLWIDTDPALGRPLRDVDDALAIHFLVCAGVEIAGLSSCFGNASLEATHRVATRLAQRWKLPIAPGARHRGDYQSAAALELADHQGDVLAIGPLTNVAAALELGAQWQKLIILGGSDRWLPNLRPVLTTELNFALDLEAAQTAVRHATHLIPMELCRRVWFRRSDLQGLPSWLKRGCRSWLWSSPLRTGRFAFHPWDVLAAAVLIAPDLFVFERRRLEFSSAPFRRGHVAFSRAGAANDAVEVAIDLDIAAFLELWRRVALSRRNEAG